MAYTSDLRIKNLIKEIHCEVKSELKKENLEKKVTLRIFDESKEDSKYWKNGGLSFRDPITGFMLGSNDAGWFIDDKIPLVIVEGTFGTERGQFGDGQLNRVSHSLGVAMNGFIGVTFIPFRGQSFIKKGNRKDLLSKKIIYANGLLHKGMATLALNYSLDNKGKFLIIDPYDKDILKVLVVNVVLNHFNRDNKLVGIIDEILSKTKNYLGKSEYGSRSNQVIRNLYNENGNKINCRARFYTQNILAFTTSSKRDAHGLLGKNLIELYSTPEKVYSIFIRLNKKELRILKKRRSKEFQYILNHPKIEVKTFDDLIFKNKYMRKKVINFRYQNLHQTSEKKLIKLIQEDFNTGKILVKL